jgi:pimeloyl-ACP methyl ester carboxylesterase
MKNYILILLFSILYYSQISAEEVSIIVNGCNIKGTLEVPKSNQPVDVALIIAGSGPTDRDGNNRLIGNNNSYKMIAELLLKNGIASLRYDKRAIGASDKVDESGLLFDTYINDAVEWVKYLKNDKRFSKVIIIGHSEGSLIGMIAAKHSDASKYISLNGAGKPIYKILDEQIVKNKLPEDLLKQYRSIMDSLKQGNLVKNVPPVFISLFRPSVQPYLISWFKYDPCNEISKLAIPILVIGGTTDIQIDVEDAQLLSKSNKNSELAVIENMNHILKEVPTSDRTINSQSYSNPELPLSDELCKRIIDFLKK